MARIRINNNGTVRTLARLRVNDNGTVRTIKRIRVNDNGTVRVVFQYLSIAVNDYSPYGSYFGGGTHVINTTNCAVTVTGGSGTFTFAWTFISGDSSLTPTSSTAATTQFSANTAVGVVKQAIYTCTVTDTVTGDTVTTDYIYPTVSNDS